MNLFLTVVLLLAAVPSWAAEVYTFDVLPSSGQIFGEPGETIGWGYSLTNQSSSLWLLTTALSPGSFLFGTPSLLFDFPILAPGATITVPFDAANLTGLMALIWDTLVPTGTVESGAFLLEAEWWRGDPLASGQFDSFAPPSTVAYSASAVPEPGTGALLVIGVASTLLARWRRQHATRHYQQ